MRSDRRQRLGLAFALLLALVALAPISQARAADPVLAASGDIACPAGSSSDAYNCQQAATASLISAHSPSAVAELGDLQYMNGLLSEFQGAGAYGATWGALNAISHPVPGNHEYGQSSTADGYFQYFGSVAVSPSGYYSYDVGGWHVIALNSNCADGSSGTASCANHEDGDGTVTTAEVQWLQSDLATHQGQCTLAYWHHPLFTQGYAPESAGVKPLWDALYAHGADVVLNGHDHVYERFSQLAPDGTTDSVKGIREFVAGEGGFSQSGFPSAPKAPVQASDSTHFGVLFLTLHSGSYQWEFDSSGSSSAVLDKTPGTGSIGCHEPLVAPTVSPTSPSTGQAVSFDAHASVSDGSTLSTYRWDFGDGTPASTQAAPSHSYAVAGSYTVTVKVTASNGVATTKTLAMTVSDRPPVASFTASPNPASTGQSVAFDASASSDPDGTVTSYAWDFGDGSTATGKTPSHTYATAGSDTVKLTVTDNSGNTTSTSQTLTIGDRAPVASFTAIPNPANTGQSVGFDASASSDPDGTVGSYAWDFGDGSTATGKTPSHTYATAGSYTVKLTATDNSGNTNSLSHSLTINDRAPVASFTATPNPASSGRPVSFDASASTDPDGSISAYSWDFGDGSTGAGKTTSHSFTSNGNHHVKLTVTDDSGNAASVTQTIKVTGGSARTVSLRALDRQLTQVLKHGLRVRISSGTAGRVTLRLMVATGHQRKTVLGKVTISLPGNDKRVVVVIRLNRHLFHAPAHPARVRLSVVANWNGRGTSQTGRWSVFLRS